ncbi:MAG: adenylate/guanylate cyclase domain-containing protein [Planctomycetes bacterium]|nr:adenylate/guanylate cyclase domain-containing protein [Planctomycetota bacterium]
MADLVAKGADGKILWRRTLPSEPVTLGRSLAKSTWDAGWDRQISGLHATLTWKDGRLSVRKEPTAVQKIYYRNKPLDEFSLGVGEHFVIGSTTFLIQETEPPSPEPPQPHAELTCSPQELRAVKDVDADQRLEVLAALPGIIRLSPSAEELESRVVEVLLQGIPRAEAAGVVKLIPSGSPEDPEIESRQWKNRGGQAGDFPPSRRLIFDAIGRRRQSVVNIWLPGARPAEGLASGSEWALCTPLPDDPSPGWGLYVTGRLPEALPPNSPSPDLLKADLKFTELVAEIFGSLRQVRDLQSRQTLLSRFLSRPVLAALAEKDMDEVLRPRETEVTVLFCDLRGSSRSAEEAQSELPAHWDRVSEALSIMTSSIIDQDGVVGDFQGDAAMGFWGWPLNPDDQKERAARAALRIRRRFTQLAQSPDHVLAGFHCGIGLAHGRAVAGRLGTFDQFKVGVFGPVVNLASRLEGLTKVFRVPILMDEPLAARLADPRHGHWVRCRRLARVQPYGMRTTLLVSELLPPAVEPGGTMSEAHRRDYEAALDAFEAGHWSDARDLLRRLPHDGPAELLQQFMERHQQQPPSGWNGLLVMDTK